MRQVAGSDKILYFRSSNFGAAFFPVSKFRGCYNGGSGYLVLHFDSMRDVAQNETLTQYGADEVRIRFNNGDNFYGAVHALWNKIMSSPETVIKVVDATVPYNGTFIREAAFGDFNQYLHGHELNTSVPSPDVTTTCTFTLQDEAL